MRIFFLWISCALFTPLLAIMVIGGLHEPGAVAVLRRAEVDVDVQRPALERPGVEVERGVQALRVLELDVREAAEPTP